MNPRLIVLLVAFFSVGLFSCQDSEKNKSEDVNIMPPEEKQDELRENETPMERSRILATLRENEDLSTFTRNLDQTGISQEFEGDEGIYTIFAPSNAAYDRIPARELEDMNNPENMEANRDRMRYYMIEGEMTLDWLREKIRASEDGRYEFTTALGEKLWASEEGDRIILTDVLGNQAAIVTSNMDDHFGVYHMIDNVLQPGERRGNAVEN